MDSGEIIRKQVGGRHSENRLRELKMLINNLRSLGIELPPADGRNVRKLIGKAAPRRS